ncbi:retrovirus-related pol polyprotein from transposon TNT 1-94 [Tanacetum coccineum]
MPPKPMSQAAIERLITERVNAAVEAERERQVNARGQGNNANEAGGQGGAPAVRECTFLGFMKCNPTVFHGHEGAVELSRWFEKTEMVFRISECAEARKVKFVAATLQGRALTWWNFQVSTIGLEAANQIGWTEMRRLMTEEFCPIEEIQRMEHELWNLKVKDFDITAYTKRFHELAQLYGDHASNCFDGTEGTLNLGPEDLEVYFGICHKMRRIGYGKCEDAFMKDRILTKEDQGITLFVTAVKLNKGLKDSNFDQLYAYLKQHEAHANENKMMLERLTQQTVDPLALMSNVSHQQYHSQSSTNPPNTYHQPHSADTSQSDLGISPTENLIENLTNTLALLTQSYKTFLPQTNNQLRTSSNPRNQATVQDGRVIVQNVQGRQNRGQGNSARGAGAVGYGRAQNRVGNANPGQARQVKCYNCNGLGHIARNCTQPKRPQNSEYFKDKMLLMQAQENGVILDEEQSLFLAGGLDNAIDKDVDEQPVQDLALNVDNVFQADDYDAYDSNVDDAPTTQTLFMANLSSADPVYDEAGPSYDSDVLSEVQNHDHYQDAVCDLHDEHEMHDDVQPNHVVDSHADYTSDSNMTPYDQYVKDNAVPVVQNNASMVPNDAYGMIDNDLHESDVPSVSHTPRNTVVNNLLNAELATYKEQVELYERRARFELTEREQKIDEQLRIVICDRNIKEENLKKELHSVKLQLASTIQHNKLMVDEVTSLKKDFNQKENKFLEEFLDLKALKDKVEDKLYKQGQSIQTVHMLCKPRSYYDEVNKVAIGYKNPLCGHRARQAQPALYCGHVIVTPNHAPAVVRDCEETLELSEISRKKMHDKMKTKECVDNKVNFTPPNYVKENFLATFTPQKQLTPEQLFWSQDIVKMKAEALKEQNTRPIKALTVYPPNTPATLVPRVLPTKSQVKINIFTLRQLFSEFDKTCKKRITPTGITEGERGFEQTKELLPQMEVFHFLKMFQEHLRALQKALTKEVKETEVMALMNKKHANTPRKRAITFEDKIATSRVVQIVLWYLDSGCSKHMTGDCSRLMNFVKKFIGTVRFGNDHFGAIMVRRLCFMEIDEVFPNLLAIQSLQEQIMVMASAFEPLEIRRVSNKTVRFIRADNDTEFVNKTLYDHYEKVGIFHQKTVPRTPQQNGVVERERSALSSCTDNVFFPRHRCFRGTKIFSNVHKTPVIPTRPSVSIAIDLDAPSGSHTSSPLDHHSSSVHHGVASEQYAKVNPFTAADREPFVNVFPPDYNSEASSS